MVTQKKKWEGRIDAIQTALEETKQVVNLEERLLAVRNAYGALENIAKLARGVAAGEEEGGTTNLISFGAKFIKNSGRSDDKDNSGEGKGEDNENFEEAVLKELGESLTTLETFARTALAFFKDGFYGETDKLLEGSEEHPPETVMAHLFNGISTDLNLLQQAIQQRSVVDKKLTQQARTLWVSDAVAGAALKPAVEAGLVETGAVACYLSRRFEVRVVPYYDIMLMGIPYSTISASQTAGDAATLKVSREHLTILHEVGHYLYHSGNVTEGASTATLAHSIEERLVADGISTEDWRHRWVEEMFADMYGLVVGGPVMALSFQEFLRQTPPSFLNKDTGEHPIAAIRPLLQNQMLRAIKDGASKRRYTVVPQRLDAAWQALLGKDALAASYQPQGVAKALSGKELLKELEPVVTAIQETVAAAWKSTPDPWSDDLTNNQKVETLFDQLQSTRLAYRRRGGQRKKVLQKYDALKKKGEQVACDDWVPLYRYSNWTTGGGGADTHS